jgi:hypothetical protein
VGKLVLIYSWTRECHRSRCTANDNRVRGDDFEPLFALFIMVPRTFRGIGCRSEEKGR